MVPTPSPWMGLASTMVDPAPHAAHHSSATARQATTRPPRRPQGAGAPPQRPRKQPAHSGGQPHKQHPGQRQLAGCPKGTSTRQRSGPAATRAQEASKLPTTGSRTAPPQAKARGEVLEQRQVATQPPRPKDQGRIARPRRERTGGEETSPGTGKAKARGPGCRPPTCHQRSTPPERTTTGSASKQPSRRQGPQGPKRPERTAHKRTTHHPGDIPHHAP